MMTRNMTGALCVAALAALFFTIDAANARPARAQDGAIVYSIERELADDDAIQESTPDDAWSGSFSVAARVQLLEESSEPGNGDHAGMIFNVGTGWYDGFRLYYAWRERRFIFQIGRDGGAQTARAERASAPGVLRDVVATYDREREVATLWIDGVKSAELDGAAPPETGGAPLNVGFGNAGIGSNRMLVDRVERWTRALSESEIATRAENRAPGELAVARVVDDAIGWNANSARLDASLEDVERALTSDIPETLKSGLRKLAFALRMRALDASEDPIATLEDFERASALALGSARQAISEASAVESEERPSASALSEYGSLVGSLSRVSRAAEERSRASQKWQSQSGYYEKKTRETRSRAQKRYLELSREALQCVAALRERFPKEAEVFRKLDKFEPAGESARRLERDALAIYAELSAAQLTEKYARFLYVAPNGSDANVGSQSSPFATLARAFEEAEKLASQGRQQKKIVVEVAPGRYQVERTARASKVEGLIVRATNGDAIFTGARPVANFVALATASQAREEARDAAARLLESSRAKVFVADLAAAGVKNPGRLANRGYGLDDKVRPIPTLYCDGRAQTLARWPNEGEPLLKFGEKAEDPSAPEKCSTFVFDDPRVNRWRLTGDPVKDDLWAFGLFQWEWAANLRRVVKLDRERKTATFDYENGSGKFDYYFVNVLEELDAPGEYYVDRNASLLYFYPPTGIETASALNASNVEYDEFDELFVELDEVSDCLIKGLTLCGGRETALAMRNCKRCFFDGGTIERFGGHGAIVADGSFCGLLNSRLRCLGGCGARIRGGNRETLEPCRHILSNCWISDFSRIDRVYAPALSADGCGIVATNNLISDSPHHAMRTDGNDIYVARNEIHSVVYEYSDQAGIDVYCDPGYRGILIERNLFHHIGSSFALCGQAGIRLDDSISGVVMKGNAFYRTSGGFFGGIQIHGGKDNVVSENVFVDCKQALSFTPWSGDRYAQFVKERFPQDLDNALYERRYPFYDELLENFNRNFVLGNKTINCGAFERNGDAFNVFAGNESWNAKPDLAALGVAPADATKSYQAVFLADRLTLRKGLEAMTGISLKDVGLKSNWENVSDEVSPKFSEEK